jgi:hypothetical protein
LIIDEFRLSKNPANNTGFIRGTYGSVLWGNPKPHPFGYYQGFRKAINGVWQFTQNWLKAK